MLNKTFFTKLKKDYQKNEGERRQIISLSNVVLHDSKRVIFALHRGDRKKAEENLREIEKVIQKMEKKFGYQRIKGEGAYKAGVEEYVEAKMLYKVINGAKIDRIKGLKLGYESYLGGLCDTTGELVRRAINKAAAGDYGEVSHLKRVISDIMAELSEFDMTGYLRTKYDQARNNLKKIEHINYEIKIRKQ